MKGNKYNSHNLKVYEMNNRYEIYMYEDSTYSLAEGSHKRGIPKPISELTDSELAERQRLREKYYRNKKNQVQRVIQANLSQNSFFLTLTYLEDRTLDDLDKCIADFKYFITKLNKHFNKKNNERIIKYVACWEVKENEDNTTRHFHFHAFIDIPFSKKVYLSNKQLSKIWSHGFTKINFIDLNNLNDSDLQSTSVYTANYVTKYMFKSRPNTFGRKSLLISRNMKKVYERKQLIDFHYDNIELKEFLKNNNAFTYKRYHYATENPDSKVIKMYLNKQQYSEFLSTIKDDEIKEY